MNFAQDNLQALPDDAEECKDAIKIKDADIESEDVDFEKIRNEIEALDDGAISLNSPSLRPSIPAP